MQAGEGLCLCQFTSGKYNVLMIDVHNNNADLDMTTYIVHLVLVHATPF